MRVDIDEQLERILEEIKRRNSRITGRGHSETIRFLAHFYLDHQSIEKMIDGHLKALPPMVEKATLEGIDKSFLRPLRSALIRLLEGRE